jgi:hypothetical protein
LGVQMCTPATRAMMAVEMPAAIKAYKFAVARRKKVPR